MHRFYDPSLFDEILNEEQMLERYAPKVSEAGAVLSVAEAAALPFGEARAKAVDVTTPEQFVAAGFSVHFSGSSEEVVGEGNAAGEGGGSAEEEHVEEDAFCNWLYLSEMRVGSAVAKWWTDDDRRRRFERREASG